MQAVRYWCAAGYFALRCGSSGYQTTRRVGEDKVEEMVIKPVQRNEGSNSSLVIYIKVDSDNKDRTTHTHTLARTRAQCDNLKKIKTVRQTEIRKF